MPESKIKILPESLTNRIAAGEVIDRPASVVKELVENSIDAGATSIIVVVEEGGRTLIQVIDDGCGMSEEDAVRAFERHSTSKIATYDDLENIRTLGFRGEALASIASVSRVEMRTTERGSLEGTVVKIEGGAVTATDKAAANAGTSIAVKNLFFNTPVRRKFLRSVDTEYRHILNVMNRFTLAFPSIAFTFVNGDEVVFDLKPSDSATRAIEVLGERYRGHLLSVWDDGSLMKIDGFVGDQDTARKSRGDQYIFVNRRYVVNKSLNHGVISAYGEILPKGEWPLYVIFLEMEPHRVDVNVHPSKLEVKFADEGLVYNLLRGAVRRAVSSAFVIPHLDKPPDAEFPKRPWPGRPPMEFVPPTRAMSSEPQSAFQFPRDASSPPPPKTGAKAEEAKVERPNLWQLHNRYILSPIKSGLTIIDQHVAHERILYERALKSFEKYRPSSQQLLFPQTVELTAEDYSHLMDILPFLERIGFVIKSFGGTTIVIEGVPSDLRGNEERVLLELLDAYKRDRSEPLEVRERVARAFACSSAVKSGDKLTLEEMNALIDQLFATELPYFCPHGRPIIVNVSLEELDRRFGR